MFSKRRYRRRNKPSHQNLFEGGQQQQEAPFVAPIQAKLNVGKPEDAFEVEADRTADKVVNRSDAGNVTQLKAAEEEDVQSKVLDSSSLTPLVQKLESEEEATQTKKEEEVQSMEEEEAQPQREEEEVQKMEEEETVQNREEEEVQAKCADCEKEDKTQKKEEEEVQAKGQPANSSTDSVSQGLSANRGKGTPMETGTRRRMENAFGNDFSGVRIHKGSEAKKMSKTLKAQAFTNGRDIYFNEGKYSPGTKEGKHLLAHELTHTIQQKGPQDIVQKKEEAQAADECKSTSQKDHPKQGPRALVCFETNSSSLSADDIEKLKYVAWGINSHSKQEDVTVTVEGFADHRGDPDYNQWLSEQRANSVANHLQPLLRSGRHVATLQVRGGGELGSIDTDDSMSLSGNRIVKVAIENFSPGDKKRRARYNLKDWLDLGVFHDAWGGDKIEKGDRFICFLENIVRSPFSITSSAYGDSLPHDLILSEGNLTKFKKHWDFEHYKNNGGQYDSCHGWYQRAMAHEYITMGRQHLLNDGSCHTRTAADILSKASWWSKRDGMPDLVQAEYQVRYMYDRFESVVKKANLRAGLIEHRCDTIEALPIFADIINELRDFPGTIYNCFE